MLARGVELAVVRPFASRAETQIVHRSFDLWTELPPCDAVPQHPVDLFLVYSRNLSEDSEALTAVNGVAESFRRKNATWHRCFRSMRILSANLTAEEDQYDPRSKAWNSLWVSGPNAVFRFLMRSFLGSKYEAFFLMELDSLPQRPHWIEQFTKEVVAMPSTAVRGSRYRGDNWDAFSRKMPGGLLSHINGNAIYFPSHPILAWLSAQLHMEVGRPEEAVAYDVRMAELIQLARNNLTTEAGAAWEDLVPDGLEPYSPDSMLIGNYANTLLNASFDGGEFIAHVNLRNIYSELNETRVTLAVSHFSNTSFELFDKSLRTIHPFREIVMLTELQDVPDGTVDELDTLSGNTTLTWRRAKRAGYLAFCELAELVSTEFFVFTDTFHVLSSPISILMDGTNKPVLPFLSARSQWCQRDNRCTGSLEQAADLFNVTLDRHFDKYDTVFVTSLAVSFCSAWVQASGGANETDYETCSVLSGPSADDYFAWLSLSEAVEDRYKKEDREVKGWRQSSLLHSPHPVDTRSCAAVSGAKTPVYGIRERQWMAGNISACNQYVEQPDQCNAAPGCMWRPIFQSGKCLDYNPMHPSIFTRGVPLPDFTATNTTTGTTTTTTNTTTTTTTSTTTSTTTTTTTTATSTTATSTTATTTSATTTTMTTVPGAPTVTVTSTATTTTSTTTTTIPIIAPIGTVLIHINETRVNKENVGAVLAELRKAVETVKNGTPQGVTNYIADPDLRIELTEESSLSLQAEPTRNEKVAILSAIRDTRCGNLTLDQCDVQEPNATVGLKAEKGAVLARRLQASAGYRLAFVVFIVIREAVDLATTMPISDPSFAATFQSTAILYLQANATASAGSSSNSSNVSLRAPTFVLFGGSGVAATSNMTFAAFAPPVASTLTVINVMLPENSPVDVALVQKEMTNSTSLVNAIAQASGGSLVLAPPVVDLCLGRTCGGNGVCSAGACQCDQGWSGHNCLIPFVPPPPPPLPATTTGVPPPLENEDEGSNSAAIGGAVAGSIVGLGCCVMCVRGALLYRRKRKAKKKDKNNNVGNVVAATEEPELDDADLFWPGDPDPQALAAEQDDLVWPGIGSVTSEHGAEAFSLDDLFFPGELSSSELFEEEPDESGSGVEESVVDEPVVNVDGSAAEECEFGLDELFWPGDADEAARTGSGPEHPEEPVLDETGLDGVGTDESGAEDSDPVLWV